MRNRLLCLSRRICCRLRSDRRGGSRPGYKEVYKFFDLLVSAQRFDGLTDDGLVEFGFGVDGVTPEGDPDESQTGDEEITCTFEGPFC